MKAQLSNIKQIYSIWNGSAVVDNNGKIIIWACLPLVYLIYINTYVNRIINHTSSIYFFIFSCYNEKL